MIEAWPKLGGWVGYNQNNWLEYFEDNINETPTEKLSDRKAPKVPMLNVILYFQSNNFAQIRLKLCFGGPIDCNFCCWSDLGRIGCQSGSGGVFSVSTLLCGTL